MWQPLDPMAVLPLVFGIVILLTAWLPLVLRRLPLSLPIIALGIGYFAYPRSWAVPPPEAIFNRGSFEHLTEFVILIALMGSGLRIERNFDWHRWRVTARMLILAMPLTIAAIALLGRMTGGLSWASALLLAAALAPTDPVLAADVQVGAPGREEGGEARFSLTTEAGLNDGLAFPFVLLALTLAEPSGNTDWIHWFAYEFVWKLVCGAAIGLATGRFFGWLSFRLPRLELSKTGDGLAAVGMTFIAYAITQLLHGNGFIAVFVAAVALRATDRGHDYHSDLEGFSEQIERILMVIVMIIFGGTIAAGGLQGLTWHDGAIGLAILLLVRPLVAWLSLAGLGLPALARGVICFFGIRGLGTLYYMAYASGHGSSPEMERLLALTSFVVLASVMLHGASAGPVMMWVDRRRAAIRRGRDGGPASA
ncbi:cation transporter [Labrys okinawensis]|uniref:Cation transporter n=1 Tax=Labrys okinawensis TaxID=346911 RepID=A0A2S9Q411_9HYPH|nr:cation:proton antiporter [Labrys okinawensis]PRH84030.1 cation transporter [Labrys okinawensis]